MILQPKKGEDIGTCLEKEATYRAMYVLWKAFVDTEQINV